MISSSSSSSSTSSDYDDERDFTNKDSVKTFCELLHLPKSLNMWNMNRVSRYTVYIYYYPLLKRIRLTATRVSGYKHTRIKRSTQQKNKRGVFVYLLDHTSDLIDYMIEAKVTRASGKWMLDHPMDQASLTQYYDEIKKKEKKIGPLFDGCVYMTENQMLAECDHNMTAILIGEQTDIQFMHVLHVIPVLDEVIPISDVVDVIATFMLDDGNAPGVASA